VPGICILGNSPVGNSTKFRKKFGKIEIPLVIHRGFIAWKYGALVPSDGVHEREKGKKVPIPDEQAKQLQQAVREHEQREGYLQAMIRPLQDESRVHTTVVELGSNENLIDALGELYDNPDLLEHIAQDPIRYFGEKSVNFPPGAVVEVIDTNPEVTAVAATFCHGPYTYRVTWSRTDGFSGQDLSGSGQRRGYRGNVS
jgi:hypothetical protein